MTYNVTVTLVFDASDEADAMDKAQTTLNAIPSANGLAWTEAHYADMA